MAREMKPINYAEDYHEMKPSLFRESENIDRLLQALFDVCDVQQRGFLWLSENLLNVDVAQGFHLDFIGGVVGQPRFLSDFNTEPYFGFDKSYQSKTFGSALDPEVGGYWNSRSYFNTATSRQLNDEEYRRLIKARAIYNQSNCSANDLLEVVNLVTNSSNNTVQILRHGLIQINTDDQTGILSYFVDRLLNEDNILPIAAGVRVGLDSITKSPEAPSETVSEFDYAVVRYKWKNTGGKDLDTRTYVASPDRSSNKVGWNRLAQDEGYLIWNGDNRESGVETVLLDIKKLSEDFPSHSIFTIDMCAFWYSNRASGDLEIEFSTYKGGTMKKSGYDFVNTGGVSVQNLLVQTNTANTDTKSDGDRLAVLNFDTIKKSGSLKKL